MEKNQPWKQESGGRSLWAGSCTEISEPLKSFLVSLSDKPAEVMHSQNFRFKFDEVKVARLREIGSLGGHKDDGNHSSSPLRENQVVKDTKKV